MDNKTPLGFEVVRIVEIPDTYLLPGIAKLLEGREAFVDADKDINEKIYCGDVMERIFEEQDALEDSYGAIDIFAFKQICELAKELRNYEFFRITKI